MKKEVEGTAALGPVDRPEDGTSTRRERRRVIVLKQERGQSLELTLQNSRELSDLGLAFDSFKVSSPANSTQSSKAKKIILKKVEKTPRDDEPDQFEKRRESRAHKHNLLSF